MKKILIACCLTLVAVPSWHAPVANSAAVSYSNCKKLNKVWPKGIAISSLKAKKQKVKPTVNSILYKRNLKLDFDKDGTICEVVVLPTTKTLPAQNPQTVSITVPATAVPATAVPATTVPATTVPVVCPTASNVVAVIQSASDGSVRSTGASVKLYYVTRNVQGYVKNNSGVEIKVLGFSFEGNLKSGDIVQSSQTVSVFNNVSLSPNDSHGWSKTYETLGARSTWSDYSAVVRDESVGTLSFISLDSRCPDPS
jgi:hypothetical protein